MTRMRRRVSRRSAAGRGGRRRRTEVACSTFSSPGNFYSVIHARTPSRPRESPVGFLYVCTERKENCLRMLSSAIKNKKTKIKKNQIKHVSIPEKQKKMFSERREKNKKNTRKEPYGHTKTQATIT
jgi:hypothetical protein